MSLDHAERKAARAHEHLLELQRQLRDFYASDPCPITRYQRPDIGLRFLRIDFKDFPDSLHFVVGDFAHNLRASLDYVVFSIVVRTTGQLPENKQIQWPVQEVKDEKALNRQTKGLPSTARDLIERLQPYHDGDRFREHPLWQLHKLDIVDKHRRITINQSEWNVGSQEFSRRAGHRYYKGDGYVEFSFPIYSPPIEILHSKPAIQFGAEDEGLFVKPERLEEIYRFVVNEVLPQFRAYFD